MSAKTEQVIAEIAQWYDYHQNDAGDLEQKWQLQQRINLEMFRILAHLIADIQELEGKPRESLGRKIWLPGNISIAGDLTKFG